LRPQLHVVQIKQMVSQSNIKFQYSFILLVLFPLLGMNGIRQSPHTVRKRSRELAPPPRLTSCLANWRLEVVVTWTYFKRLNPRALLYIMWRSTLIVWIWIREHFGVSLYPSISVECFHLDYIYYVPDDICQLLPTSLPVK